MKTQDIIIAVAAGTMTVRDAATKTSRAAWVAFSLDVGMPGHTDEEMRAYWDVLDATPEQAPTIKTVTPEQIAAAMKRRPYDHHSELTADERY